MLSGDEGDSSEEWLEAAPSSALKRAPPPSEDLSSFDSVVDVSLVPKAREARPPEAMPGAGRGVGSRPVRNLSSSTIRHAGNAMLGDLEERFDMLETVQEVSTQLQRALEDTLRHEAALLDVCAAGTAPPWLAYLAPYLRVALTAAEAAQAVKMTAKVGKAARRECDVLLGEELEDKPLYGEESARAYMAAMRKYHLRCAKAADQLCNNSVVSSTPAGTSTSSAPSPTSSSPRNLSPRGGADGKSRLALSGSAPNLQRVPRREALSGQEPGTAVDSGELEDALMLRAGTIVDTSSPMVTAPAMSSSGTLSSPRRSPRPTNPVPPIPVGIAPAVASRASGSGPVPASVPSSSPPAAPASVALGSPPAAHESPVAVAAAGRGGPIGRHLSPRRARATSPDDAPPSSAAVTVPSLPPASSVPLPSSGSATPPVSAPAPPPRPKLKAIASLEPRDLPSEGRSVPHKWEVQKKSKGRLLMAACVLTLDDNGLTAYDPKQQTTVKRAIHNVIKVTRSNRDPRKLKIWSSDGCERYLFPNGRAREQFTESVWAARKLASPDKLWVEPLNLWIGTWNLGEALPPAQISPWLQPGKFDVYVLSAQEAKYELEEGDKRTAEQHFFALVETHLGSGYQRIAQLSLMHIRMGVWVRAALANKVSNVRRASVATGIGNVIGNKGGTFVSMSINETSFCFVGCHLAAREERFEQRCQNVQQILQGINAQQPAGHGPDTWFDYVFWTGDLNYRVVADRSEVCQWATDGAVEALLAADQLSLAQREHKAFFQWTEPKIAFTPSYRFDRGSMAFSEEKMRTPSYCDRVLWRAKPGLEPVCTAYDCTHELQTSDHHPVWASFTVDTRLPNAQHPRRECRIEFSELSGRDLSFVAADREPPFVQFSATFIKPGKQSRRSVAKGSCPRWEDRGLPVLKPFFSTAAALENSHVCIAIRDGKNDVGAGVVSLREACSGQGPQPFVVELTWNGLPAGELHGRVAVVWPVAHEDAVAGDASSGATAAAGPPGRSGSLGKRAARPILSDVLKQGFLLKQGSKVKSWKRRWFVLSRSGLLAYYADPKSSSPLGRLQVQGDRVSRFMGGSKQNCVAIDTEKRRLLFACDNEADFEDWIKVLQALSSNNVSLYESVMEADD